VSDRKLILKVVLTQPFAENTYIAHFEGRSDCLIIDPGFEPDDALEYITHQRLQPAAILNTHGHVDHIAGNEAMKRCWPDIPLMIGQIDAPMLSDPALNLSGAFGFAVRSPEADQLLTHGENLSIAGFEFEIRDAPGHSPGHIVFVEKGVSPYQVLGGDVLFREGIGRTDFPGCSREMLAESIRSQLYSLPDDTIVHPGHGPSTTIGHEKQYNPFVRAADSA